LIACVADTKLRIVHAQVPERITQFSVRIASRDVTALKWSNDSSNVAVCSAKQVEIYDLEDGGLRVRLENGSGGLGRFTSVHFVSDDQLLTVWEFGRAKLWNLADGRSVEIGDIKTTCDEPGWQMRPVGDSSSLPTLAALCRSGAEDVLILHFPDVGKVLPPVKPPTVDAQSIQWSPDGRWLTIRDTPTANTSLHFYTPDGHLFRSFPRCVSPENTDLGIESVTWSADCRQLALSRYDSEVILLNVRTFAPLATIEHTTTINQSLPTEQQAPVWQEVLSATGERSYSIQHQPVAPPVSRSKQIIEPSELGVAEVCFSCDGSYLATRDERMLSTVWIWNMATLSAHAVIIQHNNVKNMHWHSSHPETLMLDCGENVAYLYDVTAATAPIAVAVKMQGTAAFSWLSSLPEVKSAILCANKSSFRVLYPEGRDSAALEIAMSPPAAAERDESYEDGASEDSILDLLSGRKPLPPRTEQSYTELIEMETGAADQDASARLDDTFREKRRATTKDSETDPLDDTDIF